MRLGEASGLLPGKDDLVIHLDIEDAAGAADELRLDTESVPDLVRQTDGAW